MAESGLDQLLDYDDLEDIPEIDLTVVVQPYMYEPVRATTSRSSSESESTSDESDSNSTSDIDFSIPIEEWCSCGHCSMMPTVRECLCCLSVSAVSEKVHDLGVNCITGHEGFIVNCLNHYVLETSYYEYIQENGRLGENDFVHELYRHIAYRRFVRWIWQILGKRNRRILPSCVVTRIRKQFPSQEYCGFKYPA